MSFTYRVTISEPDGTQRGVYTPSDELGELGEFEILPGGICGDGQFSLLRSAIQVELRDLVLVETSDDGTTFTSLYLGVVVEAPNSRSDELGLVRCVGLKQRLYETTVQESVLFEDDVAQLFRDALSGLTLPQGITFTNANAPLTDFTAGTRYPKYESVGALADALAEQVGSFIVPTATTYTYDSVVFNAGDVVPPVVWGVTAAGALVWRRPLGSALAVDETDVDTRIEWLPIEAESFVNRVNVIYATAFDLDLFDFVTITGTAGVGTQHLPDPLPIVRTFSATGVTNATASAINALAPEPLTLMTQSPTLGYDTFVAWTNPDNMVDNNPATFAVKLGGGAVEFQNSSTSGSTTGIGDGFGQGVFVLQYSSLAPIDFELSVVNPFFPTAVLTYFGQLPATLSLDVTTRVGLLVATPKELNAEGLPFGLSSSIYLETNDDVRIYLAQAFRPDVDNGGTRDATFAEAFFTQPKDAVSNVRITGINAIAPTVTITPLVSGAVTASVERVGYSITTDGGAQTVYYVDQAFAANEEAQRVVLERLARRAVREGGQA
jgi:hypothetical protein